MSERISRETLNELIKMEKQTCLSLYMPTHRSFPEREQDPIRYKNMLRELRERLQAQHPEADVATLMKPYEALLDDHDFWIYQRDGIAVLRGENFFRVFSLQHRVPEYVVVNSHPFLKPLLRIVQSTDRYQVLCLARDKVRLFEGNSDVLDEVDLVPEVPRNLDQALGTELTEKGQSGHPGGYSSAGERGDPQMHEAGGPDKQAEIDLDRDRFFRVVDRAILDHYSRPSGLPLILAGLPENQSFFRAQSHNPQLLKEGINLGQGSLDVRALQQRSSELMERRNGERLNGILDQYATSKPQNQATDDLREIGSAAAQGKVGTLLVESDREVPGQVDRDTGAVLLDETGDLAATDVLDELILLVLERGGDVNVVPAERMPGRSGAAAIYRF
ncbi:hypothetical protein HG264_05800 [Pseudomonas sp. gcc21]|uniref:baeRF3 domain-containing protein n=1 Tax=Pseudomonas sp. gcc21 TaxID=2726989 RepID=UPI001451E1BA|nr:hypothetical protein [Pseudomonas sp. gcc21]QJD58456.1 hypothetical protein HG264_05800 [Pseudomonas sp. gcc21]